MSAPRVPNLDSDFPRMKRVDLAGDHLTQAQRRLIDKYNQDQLQRFRQKFTYKNNLLGLGIMGIVASVYGYTIYAMSKDKDLIQEMEKEVVQFTESTEK
ncbi:cytochrome c oxidase assembly factor 3 homolog, mitochondrial-like [Clavelina lepadiformis]|uniref:cytochrome c oxidase assembly factor 3 homolog, mitochondrial-like n=1 Tax=Clavelina lepadiformis TaxID=159417 RepID=UPI0040415870